MSKTWEVIRFEVTRSLKKPSFWIAAILIPVVFIAYIMLVGVFSYNATEDIMTPTDTSEMKLGLLDEADYIQSKESYKNSNDETQDITSYSTKEQGIEAMKSGAVDVFYYIPSDFAEANRVEVYAKSEKLSFNSDFSEPIRNMLYSTASSKLDSIDFNIITESVEIDEHHFDTENNEVSLGEQISRMIAPILCIALFELISMILSNRLANSMVEEKENRISELLLTSIKPKDLIVGKIISLMIVGIVQLLILAIPAIIFLLSAGAKGMIPEGFDIVLNPLEIAAYLILVLASYFFITAAYVLVGTLSPTAKDASNYASFFVILGILPLITISVFTGSEVGILARIMTYIPFTSTLATSFRAIFNNLETWEYFVSLGSILISGGLLTHLATRIFCKNAIDFELKIDFAKIFGGARTSWKK